MLSSLTLIYTPFFTPVGNHRGGGVKLPQGVSPFLGQVRKKLQRLHPCIGGNTFYGANRYVPEVICTGSRYRGSRNRKLQHLWPQKSYVRNSDVCLHVFEHQLLDGNKIKMILECLLPEVHIWRPLNRKPLHLRHSVGPAKNTLGN